MNRRKLIVIAVVLALVAAYFAFDLGRFFSLEYLKSRQEEFAALYAQRPALVIGSFFAVYVGVTALSFPGAAILTLAGGAIFKQDGTLAVTVVQEGLPRVGREATA